MISDIKPSSVPARAAEEVHAPDRFRALAASLATSALQRHVLFAIATLIAVPVVGYHLGGYDQSVHLPFLEKYANPALFPGDAFLDLRLTHFSFFWLLLVPFYRAGALEPAMLAIHLAATYATFWAAWTLSETLFGDPRASLLGVLGLVFPHIGFASLPIIEFALLNRNVVLPFLLWAIALYLRGRRWQALALMGLMYNLHVISVNFALAMILFDFVRRRKPGDGKRLAVGLACFAAGALPVLLWRAQSGPMDLTPRPDWFAVIADGILGNVFYLFAPYPYILFSTLGGVSALALFFVARRRLPSGPHAAAMTNFVLAAIALLALQVVVSHWFPSTLLVQFQLLRAGGLPMIFGYLYFAGLLVRSNENRTLSKPGFGLLSGGLILSTTAALPLGLWAARRFLPARPRRTAIAAGLLVLVFIVGSVIAFRGRVWAPGVFPAGQQTAWRDAQEWARTYTPTDAVFITPPQMMGFFTPDWRVFSQRSTVVTLAELLEAAYAPEYMAHWEPRFEALAPGALAQFRGDYFRNLQTTSEAFYGLSTPQVLEIARQYGATYLVAEQPHWRDLPEAYRNEEFVVYRLPAESSLLSPSTNRSASSRVLYP